MTIYESARVWLERPPGELFFCHVPVGRAVVIIGEQFYFENHPQLMLPVAQIPELLAAGKLRARNGTNGESS
jgi:hypothetical protein